MTTTTKTREERAKAKVQQAQALYRELVSIDPGAFGHDVLFEDAHVGKLAHLLHVSVELFEKLLASWKVEKIPRLDVLESVVRRRLANAKREQREHEKAMNKLVADLVIDPDKGGPWPRPLNYTTNFGGDAANAQLFWRARGGNIVTSNGVTYTLHRGIWTEATPGMHALRNEVRQTDPQNRLGASAVGALMQSLRDFTYTPAAPFGWIKPPEDAPHPQDLVLFGNGLLDLRTDELLPLNGDYFATAAPGFDYDSEAECPRWLAWLDDRLGASFIPTLQEWAGFCMVPDIGAQRFMTFIGKGRTGKGTAKTIIEHLVGAGHVGSMTVSDLARNFGLMNALDKRLLVFPDAKDTTASVRGQALERLLAITGGDTVGIDRKNLPPVNVLLVARLMFLHNQHLHWLDESGALAARQIIIHFDRPSYAGREDINVLHGLVEELPGIANWALEGLRRLRAQNYQFTIGKEGAAIVREVRRAASPALRFAEECLGVTGNPDHHVTLDETFAAYEMWTSREGLAGGQRRNKTDLGEDLVAALRNVKVTQPRGLEPPKGWEGTVYRPRVLTGIQAIHHLPEDAY